MPTYAYACKQCGHRFDAVQSFSEPALTDCPVCGGPLRKEYGSIGVTFNGSGFYRTDSRADARAGSGEKASGDKASGEKKSADAGSPGAGSGVSGAGSAGSKSEAKASPASSGS
ncbi:MAG TPA: FmdB family zinc ribbon protein [Microbacterium sp.]|jgi:putative FmdB family regulatory protein|nr:FmdB family zinc ribbon protein [Microbacterium sp.]